MASKKYSHWTGLTWSKAAFTLIQVPVCFTVRVIHTSMSEAFTVTCTSTNTCNSVTVKSLVKIVKYLEFLAKVYSTIAGNVVCSFHWL